MNHYQVNLRSIANTAPRTPLDALREAKNPPESPLSPLAVLSEGLELLADLGIELLHVMPPFQMGLLARKGIGSPYAVADYSRIDPEFGTQADWFDLVRKAHALGLKVILGFMPNHTARDHVWLNQDPDFYVRDPPGTRATRATRGSCPHHPDKEAGKMPALPEAAYDFDWSDTAKLNYTHPPLRRCVIDTLLYWMRGEDAESGVDGYRMDMAHMINDLGFWDECIPELESAASRPLLLLAECYGLERNLDLFKRGFHAAYDDDFYKIAQYGYARDAEGHSRLLLDPAAAHNQDFAPRLADWNQGGIAAAVIGLIQAYQERGNGKRLARYVDNHDEGRGSYRFGPEACRVMMDLAACLPHSILFTLAGQEAGALNRPPIHEYFSICDKGYRLIDGDQVRNVEGIEFEGNQFFRHPEERIQAISDARKRFELRRHHPALSSGDWTVLDPGEDAPAPERTLVAFQRHTETEILTCLFNLGHQNRAFTLPLSGPCIYGSPGENILPAFSTRILTT